MSVWRTRSPISGWANRLSLMQSRASLPPTVLSGGADQVAAELLVPIDVFQRDYQPGASLRADLDRLARRFKVSTLVNLRRIRDVGGLEGDDYWAAYQAELERLQALPRGSGGDFYLTLGARASKRFTRALVINTLEGWSSFTEAFRLLGFKMMTTFRELAHKLGLTV